MKRKYAGIEQFKSVAQRLHILPWTMNHHHHHQTFFVLLSEIIMCTIFASLVTSVWHQFFYWNLILLQHLCLVCVCVLHVACLSTNSYVAYLMVVTIEKLSQFLSFFFCYSWFSIVLRCWRPLAHFKDKEGNRKSSWQTRKLYQFLRLKF